MANLIAEPGEGFVFNATKDMFEEAVRCAATAEVGGKPSVEALRLEKRSLLGARGVLRLPVRAEVVFQRLTSPEDNARIFARSSRVNYRRLLLEDETSGTRIFEVSKTGFFRLLGGLEVSWESTVLAREDAPAMEIRFCLKDRSGFMRHMSGMWKVSQLDDGTSAVLSYSEAEPSLPIPGILRGVAARGGEFALRSLLEELRQDAAKWSECTADGAS